MYETFSKQKLQTLRCCRFGAREDSRGAERVGEVEAI
jgi:hypothetical protein